MSKIAQIDRMECMFCGVADDESSFGTTAVEGERTCPSCGSQACYVCETPMQRGKCIENYRAEFCIDCGRKNGACACIASLPQQIPNEVKQ